MTTGASPISAEVMDFLRAAFGATVIEGYGMTESACTISMTHPAETTSGHVGGPLPCCEVKLEDIPEMSYTNADRPYPRGEVRGQRFHLSSLEAPRTSPFSKKGWETRQLACLAGSPLRLMVMCIWHAVHAVCCQPLVAIVLRRAPHDASAVQAPCSLPAQPFLQGALQWPKKWDCQPRQVASTRALERQ
jgi:hypothetical protein